MIVRRGQPSVHSKDASYELGAFETAHFSDAGGLTQFGAYLETLQPGSRSSERHWHEQEDEFLYLISGEAVVVENDGEQVLQPGDAACWPAGVDNAHCVVNRADEPCSYLIVGTRPSHDVCHYPDSGRTLHTEGATWRLVEANGTVIRQGQTQTPD